MFIKNLFKYWTHQIFSPETVLKEKYEAFKLLLTHDKVAHEHLADLEELYYNHKRYDFQAVVKIYEQFAKAVSGMVETLFVMCPLDSRNLGAYFKKFDFYVQFMLTPPETDCSPPFTVAFNQAVSLDETMVGKKALILSHLAKTLHLPTPNGFIITTRAFYYFLTYNHLQNVIDEKLAALDIIDPVCLENTAADIENLILQAILPRKIEAAIVNAVKILQQNQGNDISVALRSSAAKEDGTASFAGQYLTLLNVHPADILKGYKKIIAGKYSSQALFYRINHGILDHETPMAVLVLEMVDAKASGVMYTKDIEAPDLDHLVIHSVWGQGELLVDGEVSPDVIRISKKDPGGLIQTTCGEKQTRMDLTPTTPHHLTSTTRTVETPQHQRNKLSLDEPALLTLARWGDLLETHFEHAQDIEWCQDTSGHLFILQARPLHMPLPQIKDENVQMPYRETNKKPHDILCSGGQKVCPGVAAGPVYKIDEMSRLKDMPRGSVLVIRHASPRFVTAIDKIAAVVMAVGSNASHFSSIAREFGVPAIVNVQHGFHNLVHGNWVTVDADNGMVYNAKPSASLAPLPHRTGKGTLFKNSSFMRKLTYVIDFSAKLKLTDPHSSDFVPEGCRSLHDIVRFAHETAVKEMFFTGNRKGRPTRGAKKLIWPIPMLFYLLDVGGALDPENMKAPTFIPKDIKSLPMKWIVKGLLTPGIHWDEASHFDWETHDRIVMSGGIISADSPRFGSYAVAAKEYVNINFRFGYHFVILDAICTDLPGDNYILFRFSGGGGTPEGRRLRADFIQGILTRLGFDVTVKSDLVDGEFRYGTVSKMKKTLEMTGKLLGATKLMDMYLKKNQDMDFLIDAFMSGKYDFRKKQEPPRESL